MNLLPNKAKKDKPPRNEFSAQRKSAFKTNPIIKKCNGRIIKNWTRWGNETVEKSENNYNKERNKVLTDRIVYTTWVMFDIGETNGSEKFNILFVRVIRPINKSRSAGGKGWEGWRKC